tara:strand:- start:999 stop:1580 length:582 start_codon:yes stop_codon:yes gene_type:complete
MGKGLLFIFLLTLHISAKSAEVTCLVADFKAVLDVPPVQREPMAFQWINTIGNDCSYEQLEAIKNNLGSWLGTAHSLRVSTALARQLEAYYVAKNEWNEDLYTSRAAFVAPYDAGTKAAQTNTIIPPNYQNLYQFGRPQNQFGQPFNQGFQQPFNSFQLPGTGFQNQQNSNQPPNQYGTNPNSENYADPNSDW